MPGLKIRKKGNLGKVAVYEKPCIYFLIFNIPGKSMKQELLEMVQVTHRVRIPLLIGEVTVPIQTMHSLMYSSLRIFRRTSMLQLWLFESDLKVVQKGLWVPRP